MNISNRIKSSDINILIVEDSQTQAEKLRYFIEQKGYQTRVARNGSLAIAEIKKNKPNLILSDIVMPEMDGYQLCQVIKSNVKWRDIDIILLTSLTDAVDIVNGLKCGADNFIRKPYDENYLLTRIEHLITSRELRKNRNIEEGVSIYLEGNQHFINSDRQQILDLLISTYEQAVFVNDELRVSEQKITDLNINLAQRAIELETANRELDRKNTELDLANKAKSTFLSGMSHELRTPLTAIIGLSEILKDHMAGELTEEQTKFATNIFDSGEHLLSLVNDILDISKIESGNMELHLDPVDIELLLKNCEYLLSKKYLSKKINLSMYCDLKNRVLLDQRKIKQIVYNLLSNAIKFTPEGGHVTINAKLVDSMDLPKDKSLSSSSSDVIFEKYLELAVVDTGIGISENDLKRLFQSFVQLDSDLSRRYAGTGLGLVMIKKLTELHGGKLSVSSLIGVGSTFTVWFPYREVT